MALHLVDVATPQKSSDASLRYLVLLLSRSRVANGQAVRGFGRGLQGFTQGANAVNDVALHSGVLVRDASCSLPVGRHVFLLYLRGLALHFECSMQRLLCTDANFSMSCRSVANFLESVAKFDARGLVCSPAV